MASGVSGVSRLALILKSVLEQEQEQMDRVRAVPAGIRRDLQQLKFVFATSAGKNGLWTNSI